MVFVLLAWFGLVLLAAGSVWIDQARFGGRPDFFRLAIAYGLGFAPWLVLFPLVFHAAERDARRQLSIWLSLLRALAYFAASFGLIMAHVRSYVAKAPWGAVSRPLSFC